ncbi:acyl-CoA thioesterase [Ornithinimicrobium sp. F0845]|uniref:acyl-CoA thioesterase n=1 Tax=Ornithinimicrobium sp. F0845 TaxID=2926412 RepID=UPI001FF63BC3|nr:thioesterase family protein [Ornithinimicrobium sp. F0845]MCK0111585.1 acyl-CoA thioesterase [Ornithinimicrobium sp. F0845]
MARSVDWGDTDAAGHYHHSSVIRWVEAAENALHVELGLLDLFGTVPRVRYEVDYLDRLWFRDEVVTELWVESVGRTSLVYGFEVAGPRGPAARGRMVCVNVAARVGPASGEGSPAAPWPEEVRQRLAEAQTSGE